MNNLKAILLDWNLPLYAAPEELTAYKTAFRLKNQVDLVVIIPHSNSDYNLKNIELIALNAIKLSEIATTVPKVEALPYSDAPYIRPLHSLYGGHSAEFTPKPITESTYTPENITPISDASNLRSGQNKTNLFVPATFATLNPNTQVIEYARYACRLVARNNFDIIYAFDWRTYLAGMELKLISGRELVLHVNSFSYERANSENKGWMYELEKQAFTKADIILANNANIARILETDYEVNRAKIRIAGDVPIPSPVNATPLSKFVKLLLLNSVNREQSAFCINFPLISARQLNINTKPVTGNIHISKLIRRKLKST